jgi:Flp pilus assembly pilin Flp
LSPSIRVVRLCRQFTGDEKGAATAEYAIATMAAVAFAGLLVVIMRSEEVRQILLGLIRDALTPDIQP